MKPTKIDYVYFVLFIINFTNLILLPEKVDKVVLFSVLFTVITFIPNFIKVLNKILN